MTALLSVADEHSHLQIALNVLCRQRGRQSIAGTSSLLAQAVKRVAGSVATNVARHWSASVGHVELCLRGPRWRSYSHAYEEYLDATLLRMRLCHADVDSA